MGEHGAAVAATRRHGTAQEKAGGNQFDTFVGRCEAAGGGAGVGGAVASSGSPERDKGAVGGRRGDALAGVARARRAHWGVAPPPRRPKW